jgi:ATP-dependent DNA helicase RecG
MPDGPAHSALSLTTPLAQVPRIRSAHAEALARLGIHTVADLIRHLPMRYERQEAEATIDQIVPGTIASARGEVTATRIVRGGKRPRFEVVLVDHTGRLNLVWFNMTYLKNQVYPGLRLRVQGQAKRHGPGLQMANAKLEILPLDETTAEDARAERRGTQSQEPELRESRIRPVYPASEAINSLQIERTIAPILEYALKQIPDHLPPEFRAKRHLPELSAAYRLAHQPESMEDAREATRRLAYDELLMLQLGVFLRRAQLRGSVRAPHLQWNDAIDKRIRERFPFTLTGAQERVINEIITDLTLQGPGGDEPANRLIQGDVGSGKTIVALYAMLMAVANKQQAALMAPTELLAEQHFLSISTMLKGSNVKVELLTGSLSEADKSSIHRRLASGNIDILIGTHALLTEGVRFESLAVAIIDEQHRFGVHQRATLRSKGTASTTEPPASSEPSLMRSGVMRSEERIASSSPSPLTPHHPTPHQALPLAPHILVMTATPIPRTLALTLLGDLDISTIDELPPGRVPIATRIVSPDRSGEVYSYVRERLDAGEQAYVVVPLIDSGASTAGEGGDAELNDLRTVMARLEAHEFAGKKLAALHGRLKRDTREAVMARFRAGQIDALVATTIIEVGVDVPNANMMVIEHADRFGLAQLHQLRGRIGRGQRKHQALPAPPPLCVLLGQPLTPDAEARLKAMAATTDGFELAEVDLTLRGPGEVFGMRQAGAPPFKVADLMRDRDLLALARRDAQEWIQRSPTLHGPGEDLLRKRLLKLHGQWLGLADVG